MHANYGIFMLAVMLEKPYSDGFIRTSKNIPANLSQIFASDLSGSAKRWIQFETKGMIGVLCRCDRSGMEGIDVSRYHLPTMQFPANSFCGSS
jgi:hypothetical protein